MYKKITKKHKIFILIFLLFLFGVLDYISYRINPHDSLGVQLIKKYYFVTKIDRAKDFYRMYSKPFQTDEYILLLWAWRDYAPGANHLFFKDPFLRMYNNRYTIRDINIFRLVNSKEDLKFFVDIFGTNKYLYSVDDKYKDTIIDPADDLLLKALYCDISGYDEFDYNLLSAIADGRGGYGDTHFLLGLLFLDKLNCFNKEKIDYDKKNVIENIVNAQYHDNEFSDLFAERTVILYWADAQERINLSWIIKIVQNMNKDNGWGYKGEVVSNPHTTGLSILAIKYFIAGKSNDVLISK
jgi:hypothetical protein